VLTIVGCVQSLDTAELEGVKVKEDVRRTDDGGQQQDLDGFNRPLGVRHAAMSDRD